MHIYIEGTIDQSTVSHLYKGLVEYGDSAIIVINSEGGMAETGLACADLVRQYGAKTIVTGYAGSAAAVIWAAGKKRMLTPSSSVMFHRSKSIIHDSAWLPDQLRYEAMQLERLDELMAPLVNSVLTFSELARYELGKDVVLYASELQGRPDVILDR